MFLRGDGWCRNGLFTAFRFRMFPFVAVCFRFDYGQIMVSDLVLFLAVCARGGLLGISFAAGGAAFGAWRAAVGSGAVASAAPLPCDDFARAAALRAFGRLWGRGWTNFVWLDEF